MNPNIVASAIDQVDAEPTAEFLDDLRLRLLAGLTDGSGESDHAPSRRLDSSAPAPLNEYVSLSDAPPAAGLNRRLVQGALAAAVLVSLVATAAIVVTRIDDTRRSTGELNDVNAQDALPLAHQAFIAADTLGQTYRETELPLPESVENKLAADTRVAMPECEILPLVGLMQPSSKAVSPSQFFNGFLGGVAHTVLVFATPEDATKAMDVIEGDVYPACRFDLFDRMIPLEGLGQTASSEPWAAVPTIPAHGDRQIVFGQYTKFTGGTGSSEAFYVNVFVQVGRAISWMNPQMLSTDKPLFFVNKAVEAETAALESVFGR
jgi:hypothetical protein